MFPPETMNRDSEDIERDVRRHLHELMIYISDGHGTWESLDEIERKLAEAVVTVRKSEEKGAA